MKGEGSGGSYDRLEKEYLKKMAGWKKEDEDRKSGLESAKERAIVSNKMSGVLKRGDYHGETKEEIEKILQETESKVDNDLDAFMEYYRCKIIKDAMNCFGDDAFDAGKMNAENERANEEKKQLSVPVDTSERNKEIKAMKKKLAEEAKKRFKNLSDCKTSVALEARLESDDYYSNESFMRNGLEEMSNDAVSQVAGALDMLKKKFPSLAGQLPSLEMARIESNAYARASMGFSPSVEINKDKFTGDIKNTQELIKNDVKEGFHPVGTGSIAGVVLHEYGHVLDGLITKRVKEFRGTQFSSFVMQKLIEGNYGKNELEIAQQVSTYAWRNRSSGNVEFLAEAFSEYMCSESPRPVAVAVGKLVEEYAGKIGA